MADADGGVGEWELLCWNGEIKHLVVDAGSARAIDWWQMADGGVGEWEFLLCMSCLSGGWWEVVL